MMLRIFISYSRSNLDFVNPVRLILQRAGYQVWLDQRSIVPGEAWATEIEKAIGESEIVLLACSTESLASTWVQREVQMALSCERVIIPMLLEPVDLPEVVSHLQWIDFTNRTYYEEAIQSLFDALELHAQRLSEEPVPPVEFPEKITAQTIRRPQPSFSPETQAYPIEQPTGTINPQSLFYIERPGDQLMRGLLLNPTSGSTIVIRAPRQSGKSSMLVRGVHAAQDQMSKRVAYLDFQLLKRDILQSEDEFFKHFCRWIINRLKLRKIEDVECTSSKPLGHKRYSAKRHYSPILSHHFKQTRETAGAVPVVVPVSAA